MVARAAFGRALIASGGTFLALGGATFVVSSLSMGVARTVLDQRKVGAPAYRSSTSIRHGARH